MKRTNVHLAEPQLKRLAQLSKKTGLTVAELIRRAIDEYLEKTQDSKHPQN
jgi:predicted DNA-binding protein